MPSNKRDDVRGTDEGQYESDARNVPAADDERHDTDDGHEQHRCKLNESHGPHNWSPEDDNQVDWYCPGQEDDSNKLTNEAQDGNPRSVK